MITENWNRPNRNLTNKCFSHWTSSILASNTLLLNRVLLRSLSFSYLHWFFEFCCLGYTVLPTSSVEHFFSAFYRYQSWCLWFKKDQIGSLPVKSELEGLTIPELSLLKMCKIEWGSCSQLDGNKNETLISVKYKWRLKTQFIFHQNICVTMHFAIEISFGNTLL